MDRQISGILMYFPLLKFLQTLGLCICIEILMNFIGKSIKLYRFELKNLYKMNSDQNKTGKTGLLFFCALGERFQFTMNI